MSFVFVPPRLNLNTERKNKGDTEAQKAHPRKKEARKKERRREGRKEGRKVACK